MYVCMYRMRVRFVPESWESERAPGYPVVRYVQLFLYCAPRGSLRARAHGLYASEHVGPAIPLPLQDISARPLENVEIGDEGVHRPSSSPAKKLLRELARALGETHVS